MYSEKTVFDIQCISMYSFIFYVYSFIFIFLKIFASQIELSWLRKVI